MRFLTSGLKSLAVAAPFALALPVLALVDFGEGGEFAGPPAMAMAGQVFPGELTPTSAAAQVGADTFRLGMVPNMARLYSVQEKSEQSGPPGSRLSRLCWLVE